MALKTTIPTTTTQAGSFFHFLERATAAAWRGNHYGNKPRPFYGCVYAHAPPEVAPPEAEVPPISSARFRRRLQQRGGNRVDWRNLARATM